MKYVFLLFLFAGINSTFYAQTRCLKCEPLLMDGLRKNFDIKTQSSFEKDFKTYLETDTFKKDFKDKKWNLGIDVIVDGLPIKLNAGASDNQINDFQNKIKSGSSLVINESFFSKSVISIPDVDFAKVYTDCVSKNCKEFGFDISANVSEKDVFFLINFKPISVTDQLPTVTDFVLKGAKNIKTSFTIGNKLLEQNTVSCDKDGDEEIVLLLTTDKGSVVFRVPANPSGFNKDFPVGTIITSYLNFKEFENVTKNNLNNPDGDIFNSDFSKWAPCDGRTISSKCGLARATGNLLQVPDLRGLFLRGNNQFDSDEQARGIPPVKEDQKDPSGVRTRGIPQQDELKSHFHTIETNATGGNQDGVARVANALPRPINSSVTGGAETRPKNMAVFYYIRIN